MAKPTQKKTDHIQENRSCLNFSSLMLLISSLLVGFGQLQRIQLTNTVAFYGHDLFLVLFSLSTLSTQKFSFAAAYRLYHRWKYLFLFILWSVGGLLITQSITAISLLPWLYILRLLLYLGFAFCLQAYANKGSCQRKTVQYAFRLIFLLILGVGFFQYLLIPDLRFLHEYGWDVHYYRLAGNMLDPNFTGMLLVNLLVTQVYDKECSCRLKKYLGLILVLALALTYSRSSYIVLLLLALVSLIIKKWQDVSNNPQKNRLIELSFVCLVLLIPFLPRPGGLGVNLARKETISSRVEVNEQVLHEIGFWDLLFGQGFFQQRINLHLEEQIVHAKFPDNLLVFLISGTGVFGVYLITRFFIKELSTSLLSRNYQQTLLIIGALIHSMFNLTILEPINLLVLIICLQYSSLSR